MVDLPQLNHLLHYGDPPLFFLVDQRVDRQKATRFRGNAHSKNSRRCKYAVAQMPGDVDSILYPIFF